MKNLNIPVGISDMDQVTLITRPRRFGKTMAMNMVASFLDIRKDSKKNYLMD